MKIVGVIPVRLGSSRFPGKGLALLNGKEIIRHVYQRAREFQRFEKLIVATDDRTIQGLIERDGGEVFFSTALFRNGSERVAAAVASLDCEICVNIQGDEVFITQDAIEQTVRVLELNPAIPCSTAAFAISKEIDAADPNLVKVVLDQDNCAIDFSRKPITNSNGSLPTNYGHAGIYAFRKELIIRYPLLPQTTRELAESLEQLRILESGFTIGVTLLPEPLLSVNTPADLLIANKILAMEGGVINP